MSEANRAAPAISASDIETNAAAWFRRRHFWNWSAADQAELETWLGQSLAHRIAYWRLQGAWEHTGRLAALRPASAEQESAAPRKTISTAIKIAAMAIVAIVASAAMAFYVLSPREKAYATGLGGHQTVRLADGSRIELNTDTNLRVLEGRESRTVWLEKGEAFFQVKHDAAHPFVVLAGNRRVTDIGTAFVIRRDTDRLQIAVVEGRVRLDAQGRNAAPHSELLSKGDVMVASAGGLSMANRSARELTNDLGWRRGLLIFRHTTLAAAADEFNRYNREKLVIADSAVARLTLNGTFRTSDVRQFIEVAQAVFGLHVENRGHDAVISR
ncbi:MAG TPA: FecR domain-containing protein [Rhizomicrobium sp.]